MPSHWSRSIVLSSLFAVALSALGCGPRGGGKGGTTPSGGAETRHITVDAKKPVTLVGQYKQGQKVDIEPKAGQWSNSPGMPLVGPEGDTKSLCMGDGGHHCIGGDAMAPVMGLIMLMTACPIEQASCTVFGRDYVSGPVTLTVPRDGYLYLAPNDWMEAIGDNSGSVQVDVTP
jgi:hypothetical protein